MSSGKELQPKNIKKPNH